MAITRLVSSTLLSLFLPVLLLLVFSSFDGFAYTQNVTFNDVFGFGSPLDDQATGVEYDQNGDFYVTGFFSGTIDLDPGPGTYTFTTNTGGPDNYLAKFKSDGSLEWAWRQTCYSTDDKIRDIKVSSNGDIIVTGSFRQTVDFDPGPGTFNLTANGGSGGGTDIFIARYSSVGNLIFAKRIGGYLNDVPNALDQDELGNIFVCGYFKDSVDFDPGNLVYSLSSIDGNDAFFMKVDGMGNFRWVRQIGGLGDDNSTFISIGENNQILVGGVFQQSVDLDPSPQSLQLNSVGLTDCFYAMYDPEGQLVWGRTIGSTDYESFNQGFLDHEGKILVYGYIEGSLDFDPGPDVNLLTTQNSSSAFLVRYEAGGNLDYAFLFSDQEIIGIYDMIEDEYGEIYLTGTFSNTIDFDPGPGTTSLSAIGIDIFISKYNLDGSFRWAHSIRGDGWDFPGGLDISPSGEVILVGATERRTDFNIGTGTDTLAWNGNLSAFVARYDQCIEVYPDSQSICPDQTYMLGNQTLTGPGDYVQTVSLPGGCDSIVTLNLSLVPVDTGIALQGFDLVSSAAGASYQWIDCNSNQAIAGATQGTFTPTIPGDYAVVVTENGCSDTSACLTITTVGSSEPLSLGQVRMYPNPVEDVLHLAFPSPVKLSGIRLLDLAGRTVVSGVYPSRSAAFALKVPELPTGFYLVEVYHADGRRQVGRVLVK